MKNSRLIEPYKENGKTNLSFCNGKAGVYFIYRDGKLRYIGYSGYNLYKTLTRHFQRWDSKQQYVVSYANQMRSYNFQVRVCITTPGRAAKLERALIIKHKPTDNIDKLKGYTATPAEKQALTDYYRAPILTKAQLEEEVPF